MCFVGGGGVLGARHSWITSIVPSSPARAFVLAFLVVLFSTSSLVAGPYSEIVTFDSSLTDNGNVQHFLQTEYGLDLLGPPNYDGRFTNGLVYVEYLAQMLGLPAPVASLKGGKNYSFGGALAGPGMAEVENFPPGWPNIGAEIDSYLSDYTPTGDELVVISGGQNNLYEEAFFDEHGGDVAVPVGYMIDHITTLANAGVNNFLVGLLAPLGQLPSERGGPDEALYDQLAVDFNALLISELDDLESALSVDIAILDIHSIYSDMFVHPGDYGLTNVLDPALYGGSSVVPNPDEYLFWDSGHPTTAVHAHLAEAAVEALGVDAILVPEPSTAALAASALGSLIVLVLRRRVR